MPLTALALLLAAAAPVPKEKPSDPFPHAVGTKWEYVRDGDPKRVSVEEVTESEEKDGVVTFTVDITTDAGQKHFERYRLAGGDLSLVATSVITCDPPRLLLKGVPTDGDRWEVEWGMKSDGRVTRVRETFVAGKAEVIATPAGEFLATPVSCKSDLGDSGTVRWYAAGVGLVRHTEAGQKGPVQDLKAFTRGKKK